MVCGRHRYASQLRAKSLEDRHQMAAAKKIIGILKVNTIELPRTTIARVRPEQG
jgi:hypothetical protein